jgi:ankyrin repeat protein
MPAFDGNQALNPLIKKFGPEKDCFDIVFLVGENISLAEQMAEAEKAARRGISTCFIGDGKSFINPELMRKALCNNDGSPKMNGATAINMVGHGGTIRYPNPGTGKYQYTKHTISMYDESGNQETSIFLNDVNTIFHGDNGQYNIGVKADGRLGSCFGNAPMQVPDGMNLTTYSGAKNPTLDPYGIETEIRSIRNKEAGLNDTYENIIETIIHSPETLFYKENGKEFKASAPKAFGVKSRDQNEPNGFRDTEKFLRWNITRFYKFRRDELGHDIGDDNAIAEMVNKIEITPEMIQEYKNKALFIECGRGGESNSVACVYDHLQNGADANNTLNTGSTPIFAACEDKSPEMLQVLLDHKLTNVNHVNKFGNTPLTFACKIGNPRIVKALLADERTNANHLNSLGDSALSIACKNGNEEIITALLNVKGIDTNHPDIDNYLFFAAVRNEDLKSMETLLKKGSIDVNKQDATGATYLFRACRNENLEMVKILLAEDGIDVNKLKLNGMTHLDIACEYGNMEIAATLLADSRTKIIDKDKTIALANNGFEKPEDAEKIIQLINERHQEQEAEKIIIRDNGNTSSLTNTIDKNASFNPMEIVKEIAFPLYIENAPAREEFYKDIGKSIGIIDKEPDIKKSLEEFNDYKKEKSKENKDMPENAKSDRPSKPNPNDRTMGRSF